MKRFAGRNTSTENGSLPKDKDDKPLVLKDNETIGYGGLILKQRVKISPETGNPLKISKTKNGKIVYKKDVNGNILEEGGRPIPELRSEKEIYDEKTGKPYSKYPGDPNGEARHHAEQRALVSLMSNEETAAMSHFLVKCCAKCNDALGENITKVPTDQHDKECACIKCR